MKADSLLALVDQYLALRPRVARAHPDDVNWNRRLLSYWKNLLHNFVEFWSARGCPWPITSALALDWASKGTDPKRPYRDRQRLSCLRGFLKYLRGTEPETQIPDNIFQRRPRRIPRLLSEQEICRLMKAPERLRLCESFHGLTLSTLLGLLASTGLRIGEALRLKVEDAHLDADPPHLAIYETKFGKSRIVVLHSSVADRLHAYATARATALRNRSAETFFVRRTGKALRYMVTRRTFLRLLDHAGITAAPGETNVTLHCIRHRFAVRRLTLWHRAGENVAEMLPHLTVYLGHLSPADTYWYLTAAPELLEAASARFENPQQGAQS